MPGTLSRPSPASALLRICVRPQVRSRCEAGAPGTADGSGPAPPRELIRRRHRPSPPPRSPLSPRWARPPSAAASGRPGLTRSPHSNGSVPSSSGRRDGHAIAAATLALPAEVGQGPRNHAGPVPSGSETAGQTQSRFQSGAEARNQGRHPTCRSGDNARHRPDSPAPGDFAFALSETVPSQGPRARSTRHYGMMGAAYRSAGFLFLSGL